MRKFTKTMTAWIVMLAIVSLLGILIMGCGSKDVSQVSAQESDATGNNTQETTTRTVIDMAGRTVEIPLDVDRIAIAFQAMNQIIHMLGSPEKICATAPVIKTNEWYVKVYPEIMDVPTPFDWGGTTGVINFEALITTDPDVVLLYQDTGGDLEKFKELGIPVVMVPPFLTPEEIMESVLFVGEVLGEKETARAEEFVAYYKDNIKRASAIAANIPEDEIVKVFYCVDANDPLRTEGKDNISVSWCAHGGGMNVAAEAGIEGRNTPVNLEDIITWDPQAIIVARPNTYKALLEDPSWSTVSAVKNNRVYPNPKCMYWWNYRSTEEALQTLWIGTVLHPEEYSEIDMVKEVKVFYQKFHNFTLTDNDVQTILYPMAK